MNFEKIEIYGFKSFAEKAEIKFDNGITGIVGPNGCGKSNVADAIRWVLGEQSAKSLRGSSMQDVIFAGTQNRKSLSYCEVSLFFDNSTRIFNVEYDQVIITRKLFRSGESEYYINKQPARLKDIVDMLRECGLGKEGYVVIGQGKVEEIMSAKPEDRRVIFEEATGIAKFKSRKNESERKLERTHDNILRYSDILTEIENQLGPLEHQAVKAKQFNELSEELKFHELNTYVAKMDGVESAKSKINLRLKGIEEQTALRQKELAFLNAEYEKIFADIAQADVKLNALHNELLERRVGMEQFSGKKQLFEQRISYLNSQIERAEENIKENENLINECDLSITKNQEEKQNALKELSNLNKKFDDLSKKLSVLTQKITIGESLADENRKKFIQSIESLSDMKLSSGAKSIQIENLIAKQTELEVRYDALSVKRNEQFNAKESIDSLINDLDRAVYECKNNITIKEDEVRQGNEKTSLLEDKIYKLNSTITTLIARDNFYRSLKDNYEGYAPAVKNLLIKSKDNLEVKKRIKGVVAELIKSEKIYDVALETALAAAAQNVVTQNPEDAKYLIEYLKKNGLGRITFLPITSVKPRTKTPEIISALKETGAMGVADELVSYNAEYKNVISNLLGNTLIVDNIENATKIANKYRFAFKMVSLEGDVFTTQGAMTGGSKRTDSVGLLSSDRKLEDNAKQLEQSRAQMEKLKQEKSILDGARNNAIDELNILNDMYNGKRQQLLVEREKQSTLEKALIDIGREMEGLSEVLESVKQEILSLSKDFESIKSGSEKYELDKQNASKSADKHQAEYDALKKERDLISAECTNIQILLTQLNGKIAQIDSDNERLLVAKKEAEFSNENLYKSNDGAREIIEKIKLEEEKITLSKEEQDSVNEIRENIHKIEDGKSELRSNLSKNDEDKNKVSEQLSDLIEKKHIEEIALTKIDSDIEYLGKSIWEDYQETYETALKFKKEGYDGENGEKEILRIRRKRSSLGAINANAIEESKALRERYQEMTAQKEDLEKAESDLRVAIEQIKGEMLAQFNEGFTKIN